MSLAIKLNHINKTFKIPTSSYDSLRERFINLKLRGDYKPLHALKNINLEVKKGQWLGLVGPNGSGKSTLLKIIAGIYQPNQGKVEVNGHLVPFLELGVGFNLELSAKDNIFLNGVILGMTRKKITQKFNAIVNFADIKPFINQKLKNFSSGMQVRLAFSIAIQASGDIYLLDEVMAVGDHQFRQKSEKVFQQMKKQTKTIILVSHDFDSIIKYCDQAIWLDHGKIISHGAPKSVVNQYTRFVTPR